MLAAVCDLVVLEAPNRVRHFGEMVGIGQLTTESTVAALQDALQLPAPRLAPYRAVLAAMAGLGLRGAESAVVIDAALTSVERVRSDLPQIEVARTGPSSRAFELRTTGVVSREVIDNAQATLLLVGYSVVVNTQRTGLVAETVDAIIAAAARGVVVTAVLHRDPKNRAALLNAWPGYARRPSIFTWPESPSDEMTKLHAKVIVGDRCDALVTSANLTYHGMEANIELGLRVTGEAASQVEAHFRDLIRLRELVTWDQ